MHALLSHTELGYLESMQRQSGRRYPLSCHEIAHFFKRTLLFTFNLTAPKVRKSKKKFDMYLIK
jgi:hypothetical protein